MTDTPVKLPLTQPPVLDANGIAEQVAQKPGVERNVMQMVPIDEVTPAHYNPRETDQMRLAMLKLSLSKLGFILPLYTTTDGEMLSGHQRLLAAKELGCTHVPVVRLAVDREDKKSKNINLIFNRATNDMKRQDTSESLWENLTLESLSEFLEQVPDKDPNSPEFFRCISAEEVPIPELVEQTKEPYNASGAGGCTKLLRAHVIMPVVRSESGRIVNGVFRVMAAGEMDGRKGKLGGTYPTVTISDAEAEIAERLLNMISMRFTVEKQYADVLRFGAYRRASHVVPDVRGSIRYWADGERMVGPNVTMQDPYGFWNRFRQIYGESCLDFGAGQRRTEGLLVQKGIWATSWEPYPLDWMHEIYEEGDPRANTREPCVELSRKLTDNLLNELVNGRQFSAIFATSVFNSVPFLFDRLCALSIIHAMCSYHTKFVGSVRSVKYKEDITKTQNRVNKDGKIGTPAGTFELDYEDNITLGDIAVMPKVQKFHTENEWARQLSMFWEDVDCRECGPDMPFKAMRPKRINLSVLRTAIHHEFNLPYRGGDSINRHLEAEAAFSERLKVDLTKVPFAPKPENT